MKVILFSGAHGVGKGFFLDKVSEDIPQYQIYSASNLIERYQSSTDAGYKKVSNVNSNQDVLIKAIKEVRSNDAKSFILDGHLCIFNAKGEVERIPEYFFIETQITGIILLQDAPRIICDRIRQRDCNKISIHDIERMQNEEKNYAIDLEAEFQIKYEIITHECTGKQFGEKISKM